MYKTKKLFLTVTMLSIALFITPLSFAQTEAVNQTQSIPAEGNTSSSGSESFTMNMREADIRGFIQWIADRTKKNIIVHRSVRGTATVLSSRPVSAEEAYELFLTVLALNGFAAIETDGAVKVVPDADAKTSSIPFVGSESQQGEVVTAIIDLKHSDAAQFVGTLRPLIPAAAHLAAYPPTNALIVADTARGIEKINQLVYILDKKDGETELEIIPIVHASAEDIVSVIETVAKALDSSTTKTPNGQKDVNFSVDKRSNAILIIGNKKKRQQMKKLIARLDTPLDGNGNTQVIYLNYITAEEIKPILQSVGDSVLKENKTEGLKSFSIESSETTNSLIISAPPSLMNNIKSIITQLDIQRAQVLIEAVIVQISGNAGDDFGVIWGASEIYQTPLDGGVAGVNIAGNTSVGGLATAATTAAASDDGLTSSDIAAGLLNSSGLTFGYLKDGNLIGALQLISSRNKTNIMSTPSIVALDNEEASLLVGQNIPFVTGSATSSGSTVTNPFQTIERQDIGITLKVTPRINQGDAITLEIEQTTENVSTSEVAGASDLVTEKTEIKTNALIKDGEVLVLGGLIREDETKSRSQVPILGHIPLVGRLFRSSSTSKRKNNLMVFIRPIILKDRLQVTGITAQRYAFMRDIQLQKALNSFITYSDKPVLEEFDVFSPTAAVNEEENTKEISDSEG